MFFITLKPSVTDSALFHRQIEFVVLLLYYYFDFFFSYKKTNRIKSEKGDF